MKTCLHTLLDKCIQMLENGAEVLYYSDDRALQSRCPKHSIFGRSYSFIGHRPVILHQMSKNLATTTVC